MSIFKFDGECITFEIYSLEKIASNYSKLLKAEILKQQALGNECDFDRYQLELEHFADMLGECRSQSVKIKL